MYLVHLPLKINLCIGDAYPSHVLFSSETLLEMIENSEVQLSWTVPCFIFHKSKKKSVGIKAYSLIAEAHFLIISMIY